MNRKFIIAWFFLLTFSLFIIFNYMPAMIELSALETENKIFIQLEEKVKELEVRFEVPEVKDVVVKTTSIGTRKQFEKQMAPQRGPDEQRRVRSIRDSRPLNPFNPDHY